MDDEALERLVLGPKGGNPVAVGRLFGGVYQTVLRFIAPRAHRPRARDGLPPLVFVKALEALPRYEQRGIPFGGWLFRLARNTIIDHARTRPDHADLQAAGQYGGGGG